MEMRAVWVFHEMKNSNEIRTIITQKQQVRKRSFKTHVSFTTSTWQIRNTKAFSRNAHSTHTFYNLLVNVNAHLKRQS